MPVDDVREVSNYVAAQDHSLARLRKVFPLSLRLIKEMHLLLLAKGRGSNQTPDEFRRPQNWYLDKKRRAAIWGGAALQEEEGIGGMLLQLWHYEQRF